MAIAQSSLAWSQRARVVVRVDETGGSLELAGASQAFGNDPMVRSVRFAVRKGAGHGQACVDFAALGSIASASMGRTVTVEASEAGSLTVLLHGPLSGSVKMSSGTSTTPDGNRGRVLTLPILSAPSAPVTVPDRVIATVDGEVFFEALDAVRTARRSARHAKLGAEVAEAGVGLISTVNGYLYMLATDRAQMASVDMRADTGQAIDPVLRGGVHIPHWLVEALLRTPASLRGAPVALAVSKPERVVVTAGGLTVDLPSNVTDGLPFSTLLRLMEADTGWNVVCDADLAIAATNADLRAALSNAAAREPMVRLWVGTLEDSAIHLIEPWATTHVQGSVSGHGCFAFLSSKLLLKALARHRRETAIVSLIGTGNGDGEPITRRPVTIASLTPRGSQLTTRIQPIRVSPRVFPHYCAQ
ncbi:hypothetical protein [Nostocoides jenkinsii]|nr:hypothetical protein [Tetrasphaera jenkinsii]